MQNLGEINKVRARRPYWLLLALALFFAGQIAIAAHWHDAAPSSHTNSTLDSDCALCVLSSTAGAAVVAAALVIAGIALCAFLLTEITRTFISQRAHAYQSRAPPLYS